MDDNIKVPQLSNNRRKKKKKRKNKNGHQGQISQAQRLNKAKKWIPTYTGENLLKCYRKHFKVDRMQTIRELQILGYEFSEEVVEREKRAEADRIKQKQIQKAKRQAKHKQDEFPDSNDYFFYIAGYTSGGAPYGVTWEEMGLNPYQRLDDVSEDEMLSGDELYNVELEELPKYSEPLLYSELDEYLKQDANDMIVQQVSDFLDANNYIPTNKQRDKVLTEICCELMENYKFDADWDNEREIIPDNSMQLYFNDVLMIELEKLKAEGIFLKTYYETLTVAETERLIIRKFTRDDIEALYCFMKKSEVMYAWEHGFSKNETRRWINQQISRYEKDGYGYYALMLKVTKTVIGQIGLLKSNVNNKEVTELGYILDNKYWHNGYATEGAKACIDLAFDTFGLSELYCTIRPENKPSVKLAEKLGFKKIGEYTKKYNYKEMLHNIYTL